MRWQEYEPQIGPKTVLTYKEHYKCCCPYFGVPNVFQTIRNKVKGFDRITEYLNRTAKIEFTYEQDRPVVAFAPNIAKNIWQKSIMQNVGGHTIMCSEC